MGARGCDAVRQGSFFQDSSVIQKRFSERRLRGCWFVSCRPREQQFIRRSWCRWFVYCMQRREREHYVRADRFSLYCNEWTEKKLGEWRAGLGFAPSGRGSIVGLSTSFGRGGAAPSFLWHYMWLALVQSVWSLGDRRSRFYLSNFYEVAVLLDERPPSNAVGVR